MPDTEPSSYLLSINSKDLRKIFLPLAIISLLFQTACINNLVESDSEEFDREVLRQNFEHLWKTVDEKYSFFEDKNIDWDSVYTVYTAKVNSFQGNSIDFFNLMADMLFTLEDGHVNLSAGFDLSRNWEWYLNYPQNFNLNLLERNYFLQDYQISGPLHSAIIDSVGYIYYGSFSSEISESLLDYLMLKFTEKINEQKIVVKGIIIDVRDNGGGLVKGANLFAGRFTDKKRLVSKRFYKTGPAHDAFSEPHDEYIEVEGDKRYTGKVVVLTNRSCYSATNFFVNAMKQIPNVTIIGDKTGGGGGLPINNELPLGWRYRFSTTRSLDPSGHNLEFGIEPDIYVDMDPEDEKNGIDTILETALNFIKE